MSGSCVSRGTPSCSSAVVKPLVKQERSLAHSPFLTKLGDVMLQVRMDEERALILLQNYRGQGVVKYLAYVAKKYLARPCLSQNLYPSKRHEPTCLPLPIWQRSGQTSK